MYHGGSENSSALKQCKPIKNSETKWIEFQVAKSVVEESSYNVKLAKILCWEGQDKQTGIQTQIQTKKQTNKIFQTQIKKLSVT